MHSDLTVTCSVWWMSPGLSHWPVVSISRMCPGTGWCRGCHLSPCMHPDLAQWSGVHYTRPQWMLRLVTINDGSNVWDPEKSPTLCNTIRPHYQVHRYRRRLAPPPPPSFCLHLFFVFCSHITCFLHVCKLQETSNVSKKQVTKKVKSK